MLTRPGTILIIYILTFSALPAQTTPEKLLSTADSLYAAENYEPAYEAYRQLGETARQSGKWHHLVYALTMQGECNYYFGACEHGLDLSSQAYLIATKRLKPDTLSFLPLLLENLGYFNFCIGNFDEQMRYYRLQFEHVLIAYERKSKEAADAYYNMGMAYITRNQWERGAASLDTSLQISQEVDYQEGAGHAYAMLAVYSSERGDYTRAIFLGKQALSRVKNKEMLAGVYHNLASDYISLGHTEEAMKSLERSLELHKKEQYPEKHFSTRLLMARAYHEANREDQALKVIEAVISEIKNSDPDNPYLRLAYNYKASILVKRKQYKQGEMFARKALAMPGNELHDPGIWLVLSRAKEGLGQFDEALSHIQQGLQSMVRNFKPENRYSNPLLADIENVDILLDILSGKAYICSHYYAKKGNREAARTGLATFELIDSIVMQARRSYQSHESKDKMAATARDSYAEAIKLIFLLYQDQKDEKLFELALSFSEKSRALSILERLNENQAKLFTKLPASLVDEEQQLLQDIAFYTNKINNERAYMDPSVIAGWEKILFEKRKAQDTLLSRFAREAPQYLALKYSDRPIAINLLREELLGPDEVMLEYFMGGNSLYIFHLSKDHHGIIQVNIEPSLNDLVDQTRRSLESRSDQFFTYSYRLYQLLIEPVKSNIHDKNLIIIPDGILGYVPFEALLEKPAAEPFDPEDRHLPYLIRRHACRYYFSAQLGILSKTGARRPVNKEALAFAPNFTPSVFEAYAAARGKDEFETFLSPLKGNIEEIDNLNQLFRGQYFTGAEALKSDFLTHAPHFNLIHIATHAIIDDANPNNSKLIFSIKPGFPEDSFSLHAYELYNLDLGADLVTLSACNTGKGALKKGEGIASLARAFAFAGCPNLVMSLWQVKDNTTPTLMASFYDYLAGGRHKDQALYQAKLDYLDRENPLLLHPYYWACFIYVGDQSPLEVKLKSGKNEAWIWILLIGFTVAITGILYRERRRRTLG